MIKPQDYYADTFYHLVKLLRLQRRRMIGPRQRFIQRDVLLDYPGT